MADDYRTHFRGANPVNPEASGPTFTVLDRGVAEAKERS
jgi:hypothetical protein